MTAIAPTPATATRSRWSPAPPAASASKPRASSPTAGVHVLLAGRDRDKAVDAALKLQAEGLPVEAIALDVTDDDSIAAAAQEVARKHGRLDILVNNAGMLRDDAQRKPSEQSLATWRETFDTNVFGVVAATQAFLPLLKQGAGRAHRQRVEHPRLDRRCTAIRPRRSTTSRCRPTTSPRAR